MKILVTGAKGQLGQALQALSGRHEILAYDHARLDITDGSSVESIISSDKPSVVINAAAYNDVDKAESEPEKAFAVNSTGPENLARTTAQHGIPFVHVSTDYVFDGRKGQPYHELDQVHPLSQYAKSKWSGEEAVRKTNPKHFVVRTAWLFHSRGENFFTKLLRLAQKGPLKVVSDQFSSPTYAPHLAEGLLQLIDSGMYGTYHLAGAGGTSRFEEFKYFLEKSGKKIAISPVLNSNFKQIAERPVNTVMTTIQVPRIILPHWEQGVDEFVKDAVL